MKLYKVILVDKRDQLVPADTYQSVGGQFVFFANGEPIPDVFFLESAVIGITVERENFVPLPPGAFEFSVEGIDAKPLFIDPNAGLPGHWSR